MENQVDCQQKLDYPDKKDNVNAFLREERSPVKKITIPTCLARNLQFPVEYV